MYTECAKIYLKILIKCRENNKTCSDLTPLTQKQEQVFDVIALGYPAGVPKILFVSPYSTQHVSVQAVYCLCDVVTLPKGSKQRHHFLQPEGAPRSSTRWRTATFPHSVSWQNDWACGVRSSTICSNSSRERNRRWANVAELEYCCVTCRVNRGAVREIQVFCLIARVREGGGGSLYWRNISLKSSIKLRSTLYLRGKLSRVCNGEWKTLLYMKPKLNFIDCLRKCTRSVRYR